jgi:hypothetical protein
MQSSLFLKSPPLIPPEEGDADLNNKLLFDYLPEIKKQDSLPSGEG